MKVAIASLLVLLAVSCNRYTKLENAVITGEVINNEISEVKFLGVIDNSIGGFGLQYQASVDSSSQFFIEIPIDGLAKARLSAGHIYQDLCLIPGDRFHIQIFQDSISFEGRGAAKNKFLIELAEAGLGGGSYSSEYNKGVLAPVDFEKEMRNIREKRIQFLSNYSGHADLEDDFKEFFMIQTEVIYIDRLINYPKRYSRKAKINLDSIELSDAYKRQCLFDNIINDSFIISFDYVHGLRNYVSRQTREMLNDDPGLSREEALYSIILDSLNGKTKEYVLAQWLIGDLSNSRLDTLLYQAFQGLAKDDNCIETVNSYYLKYKEKQALIGQVLHDSFRKTVLIDSTESELFFEDMIEDMKGKVIYLDIWSLRCAPCLTAMPHSKKLKDRLDGLPIEFVYIAQDPFSQDVWDEIYRVTNTDENHFRMASSDWGTSKMLQYLEINWVPCYMIFDKQGRLLDYNAEMPYVQDNIESNLEKRLKQLAS